VRPHLDLEFGGAVGEGGKENFDKEGEKDYRRSCGISREDAEKKNEAIIERHIENGLEQGFHELHSSPFAADGEVAGCRL